MPMPLRVLQIWDEVDGQLVPTQWKLQVLGENGWEEVTIVHEYPKRNVAKEGQL